MLSTLGHADDALTQLRERLRRAGHRTDPRYPTCRSAAVRPELGTREARQPALLCDVSVYGLGLFIAQRHVTDARLLVELPGVAVRPRFARVARASQAEGGWLIGCELDRPLNGDELAALREPEW
jgi:hypothetical protein